MRSKFDLHHLNTPKKFTKKLSILFFRHMTLYAVPTTYPVYRSSVTRVSDEFRGDCNPCYFILAVPLLVLAFLCRRRVSLPRVRLPRSPAGPPPPFLAVLAVAVLFLVLRLCVPSLACLVPCLVPSFILALACFTSLEELPFSAQNFACDRSGSNTSSVPLSIAKSPYIATKREETSRTTRI